ncbi:MAG: extracellular solute-binding protein [Caldilineaceae bacterium]
MSHQRVPNDSFVSDSQGISRRAFLQWSAIAGGLMATGAMAACAPPSGSAPEAAGGSDAPAGETPEVVMWARKQFLPESNDWLMESAQMAGEANGFTVRVDWLTNDDATQKQFAAAEAGTLPDLNSTLLVAFFKRIGVAMEVSDIFNEVGEGGGGFYDAPTQKVTIDGEIYAVPLNAEPWFIHYRKSIFEAKGLNPPFDSLEELRAALEAVNDPGNGLWAYGGQMANADFEGNTLCSIHAHGGQVFDENNNVIVNSPEALAGITYYTNLYKDGLVPPGATGWDAAGNNQAYLSGQVACISNTGSVVLAMRNDNQEMLDDTVIGPWPKGGENGRPSTVVGSFGLLIHKETEYVEQCKDIIRNILSPERYPGNLEAAGSYWFSALKAYDSIPFFTEDPWNRMIQQDVIPHGRAAEYASGPNSIYDELANAQAFGTMIEHIVVDGMEPQAALDELDATAQEIAAKYSS